MIERAIRATVLITTFGLLDAYIVWGWWEHVARDLWPTLPTLTYGKTFATIIATFVVWKALVIIALDEQR